MALGAKTIADLKDSMYKSGVALNGFSEQIKTNMNSLRSDANYQKFIENTDIGQSINEKLGKLYDIGVSTGEDIKKLVETTKGFLEQQEMLNKAVEQRSNGVGAAVIRDVKQITADVKHISASVNKTTTPSYTTLPGGIRVPSSAISRAAGGGNNG